jgi:hypothetical protein
MSAPLQAALIGGGSVLCGMLVGALVKKSYRPWRDRKNSN